MAEDQISTHVSPTVPAATSAPVISEALSGVLSRTNRAVGEVVDLESVQAQEVGVWALLRAGNVLRWFRSGVTSDEVAEYAAIVDAMVEGRRRIMEAANDASFSPSAASSAREDGIRQAA